MTDTFNILIADRNPHVREFLRRELAGEGYRVQVARNGREVVMMTNADDPPDLLILDLDIPHVSGLAILEQLQDSKPPVPVVVHTLLAEYANHPTVQKAAAFVEKKGNNIDAFKQVVSDVLLKWYPQRIKKKPNQDRLEAENSGIVN
ncbi:MAG: response regulator [Desulfobacterales bacterium]|nr:response regulator [Desulfobacterales bacterium]